MTNDDWKEVEEALKGLYRTVELDCDGYSVALKLVQIGTYQNGIWVYVNGKSKLSWTTDRDSEEAKRFCMVRYKYLFPAKYRAACKKGTKKAFLDKFGVDPNRRYSYREPYWTSFAALKRHFIKNNDQIKLVRIDAY